MSFQIGLKFDPIKHPDSSFERALDRIRNAEAAPAPVLLTLRNPPRRSPTRFQARLAEISKAA
jgi:hypothetical protein